MSDGYEYKTERATIFTESGLAMLLKIRDRARYLLSVAGAFRETEVRAGICGDSWRMLACVDYLVEQKEIIRVFSDGARQHNIYTKFNYEGH